MKQLETADAVIDALGGTTECASLTGHLPQSVSNWRGHGFLPRDLHFLMSNALAERGYIAPPGLWRQKMPTDSLPAAQASA